MTSRPLVHLEGDGDIAVLVIDNPPVNALSPRLAAEIDQALDRFEAEPRHQALVLTCVGRTFVAGGDIAAFEDPDFSAAPINRTLARLERQARPVVAALHGHVLGGGLELAMACHWRVAEPATRLGLPEITLGLIPGSLGTQRLPRLVGLERAFDMMASGHSVDAPTARDWGLVDALSAAGADSRRAGVDHARELIGRGVGPWATCHLPVDRTGVPDDFFAQQRQRAYADRARFPAALLLVDAVEAAAASFEQGELVEARGFELARQSAESKALRYLFFAQRKARHAAPLHDDLSRRAFTDALAQSLHSGVAPARLALALRGFGWTCLPAGLDEPTDDVTGLDEPQLLWPLLDSIVEQAVRSLEQGEVARASDIDVAWTRDHGFPAFRGGPLYNADASGLHRVIDRLAQRGRPPCRLLCELAQQGRRLCDHVAPA